MKLNNKGFAISSIMYIILILAVILISVTLAILSSRKLILDKIKKETTDNIYGISYNSVINTLKHEAINYAFNNNVEQENIKIGDFETSVSQELLEHHELTDKYLTLFKNNNNYDVYLGQTKKITDVSKPIDNMIGIVDYKIEGNSYQQTYTGKNLFDYDLFFEGNTLERGGITYTKTEKGLLVNGATTDAWSTIQAVSVKDLLEVGKTYTITDNINNVQTVFCSKTGEDYSYVKTKTITGNESEIKLYLQVPPNTTINNVLVPLQLEEGTKTTSYEPYVGGVASPNPKYPQEIQNVGDKTNNLAEKLTNINSSGGSVDTTILVEVTSKLVNASLIKVKPGQKYSLSKTVAGKDFRYFWYDTNPVLGETQSIGGQYLTNTQTTANITAPENAKYLFVRWSESYDAGNVQIKENDTSTEYESYGYKIPVKVRSRNLFNIPDITRETGNVLIKIECNLTKPVVVSSQEVPTSIVNTNGEETSIWRIQFKYLDGTISYALDSDLKRSSGKQIKASEDNPVISITYRGTYIREGKYGNIQIEYGNTPTDYEPYIEPVTTNIYLNEPLRKVGDYADYIDFENQKVVRNIFESSIKTGSIYGKFSKVVRFSNRLSTPAQKENKGMLSVILPSTNAFSSDFESILHHGSTKYNYYPSFLWSRLGLVYDGTNVYKTDDVNQTPIADGEIIQIAADFIQSLPEEYRKIYMLLDESIEQPTTLPSIQTNIGASIIEIDTKILPNNVEFTIIEKIRKL